MQKYKIGHLKYLSHAKKYKIMRILFPQQICIEDRLFYQNFNIKTIL